MPIYALSYYSRNLIEDLRFDTLSEIDQIFKVSASRNAANGVTGTLMFTEARFTQYLEGDHEAVKRIFDSIRHDPRHSEVTILATQTSATRRFSSWTMTFVGATSAARAYYHNYTAEAELFRKTLQQDMLCKLMFEIIALER